MNKILLKLFELIQTYRWQHWICDGYQYHLLFERLYEETSEQIDVLAEFIRAIDIDLVKDLNFSLIATNSASKCVNYDLKLEEEFRKEIENILSSENLPSGTHPVLDELILKSQIRTYLLKLSQ